MQAASAYVNSALFDRGNVLVGTIVTNSTVQPGWNWEVAGGATVTEWAPLKVSAADAAHGAVVIRFPGASSKVRARCSPARASM